MSAPDKIWALSDRRKHWQGHAPEDGQHAFHWVEYLAHTPAREYAQELVEALEAIAKDRGGFMGEYHADCQEIARKALAKVKEAENGKG